MKMPKDYYATLNVERSASPEAMKVAYRRLARKLHPDVSREVDAEERFKALTQAYEVLRDPARRAAYDRYLLRGRLDQPFRSPPDFDPGFVFQADQRRPRDFSDFFDQAFGGRKTATAAKSDDATPGEDALQALELSITLADTYHGATRMVGLRSTARQANGETGFKVKRVEVSIPKGIVSGERIHLAGEADGGGDLALIVRLREQPNVRIKGKDVYLKLPVAPWEAMLGAIVTVPAPGGVVELAVPPGSQAGKRLRLRGRGIPADPAGDLYVELQIALPPVTTEAAAAAYRALAQASDFDPRIASAS